MKIEKPFLRSEFSRRIQDVKQRMAQAGLDLLICQDPANMYWLTGYDGHSYYVPQAVLVHLQSDTPIWFGRFVDVNSVHVTTDLPTENIVWFSDHRLQHPELHPFDDLCDLINSRGWGKDRIGVEMNAHYYTARAHQHLVRGLPDATFQDSRELVNWARLIKSEAELVYMREAGRLATHVMQSAIDMIKPGVPQHVVAAEVNRLLTLGVDNKYGDSTAAPLIQTDEQTNAPHLGWTDEPLPASGLMLMEFGATRRRYCVPLCRTVHIGKPPEDVLRLAEAIIEGGDKVLEMARPGMVVKELNAAWHAVLKRYGYTKVGRSGYSIGLFYMPEWGERTVSIRDTDETVLQKGMCFHFQSGVRLKEFGAAISESFVVTDKGGKRFANVDRRLMVVD